MTKTMMRIRILVAIIVIAFVLLNCILFLMMVPAHAQSDNSGATPAQRKACTPDVYRLCAGEIPNVARITSCLRRNKARLSEGCRAVFGQ